MESSFPPEPQEIELSEGEIFWFDGSVLEIFAGYSRQGGGSQYENSMRIHAKQLEVRTKGPDRKNRYEVTFAGPAFGFPFRFEEADWNTLQPFLESLRNAGVEFP